MTKFHWIGQIVTASPVIGDLKNTGKFGTMSIDTDRDEHSIEMHLPYVYQLFKESVIPPTHLSH